MYTGLWAPGPRYQHLPLWSHWGLKWWPPEDESGCPGTCDHDFIWEKGLCWCHQVQDLKMRSFWIIWGGGRLLSPMTSVLTKDTQRSETEREENGTWRWRQRVQWCNHKPTSQGSLERPEAGRSKEGFHPRASEGAQSWDPLIQDFQSWEPWEKTLLCFNPQGHGNLQQQL